MLDEAMPPEDPVTLDDPVVPVTRPTSAPLRILMLEDSAPDADLEIALLEEAGLACACERVETREEFLARLPARDWDLILADYQLPSFDGLTALALVGATHPEIPFVLISGTLGEEMAIEALQAGATDYVLKQRLGRLVPVVRRALREREELRRRREAEAAWHDEARIADALARVGREMIASLSKPALLDQLCRVTAEALGCQSATALLHRPQHDAYALVGSYGWTRDEQEAASAVEIARDQMAELVARLEDDVVVELGAPDATGMLSLCMALRRGEEIVGVQLAHRRPSRAPFTAVELRIAQGVAQLASIALEDARLMEEVQAASRLKSDFVATMSHELRTPLNVILGYLDLVLDGDFGALGAEQEDALQRVRTSARELFELVSNTLDMGRLERGEVPVLCSEVRLADLARELADETLDLQQKAGVSVGWQIEPALPTLHTDPAKLKVVLRNLIRNAVKFTDAGSVAVHVRAHEQGVEISVADTGVGISPEVLPIIFEAFRQGESAMTRRHGGAGLGLYITRRLLDLLGGRVEVESEPGGGSTFRVVLPASTGETARHGGQRGS